MKDKFNDIVDYAFTAQMEERLDKVEEGGQLEEGALRLLRRL